MTSSITRSELYDEDWTIHKITLGFGQRDAQLRVDQNRPNPFDRETVIGYDVPASTDVMLTIYDLAGRQVLQRKTFVQKGYHEWSISSLDLPVNGVLYYKLETDSHSNVRKMIRIDH